MNTMNHYVKIKHVERQVAMLSAKKNGSELPSSPTRFIDGMRFSD